MAALFDAGARQFMTYALEGCPGSTSTTAVDLASWFSFAEPATPGLIMPSASMRLIFPELYEPEGLEPHDVGELYLTNTTHTDRWLEVTEEDIARQVDALRAHASQISRDPLEWVMEGAKEEAVEARRYGHDFKLASGFKYFRFRR